MTPRTSTLLPMLDLAIRIADVAPQALLLGDTRGSVSYLNAMARRIVAAGDGLRIEADRLVSDSCSATQQIRDSWRRVLGSTASGASQTQLVQVSRHSGSEPYQLMFSRLSAVHPGEAPTDGAPAIAVQLFDPAATLPFNSLRLCALYGLTRSEAEVAIAIAQGLDVASIARNSDRAIDTVRGLLKRAMAKTGACRQNKLTALLWRGAAGPMARQGRQ